MSANPQNPEFELPLTEAHAHTKKPQKKSALHEMTPGREALQALLAFSALHTQIRERRAQLQGTAGPAMDPWQVESFMLDEVLHLVAERAMSMTGADGI